MSYNLMPSPGLRPLMIKLPRVGLGYKATETSLSEMDWFPWNHIITTTGKYTIGKLNAAEFFRFKYHWCADYRILTDVIQERWFFSQIIGCIRQFFCPYWSNASPDIVAILEKMILAKKQIQALCKYRTGKFIAYQILTIWRWIVCS